MKEIQRLLGFCRRAADDYGMIKENDHIAVGVSGGKDSLALLYTLAELRRFYPVPFRLSAVTVDMGFKGSDFSAVKDFCEGLSVPYRVAPTDIAEIIFDVRRESNPCSLCAKMRRGVLHSTAKEMGCNKVALGHHFDDAVETFMMNLFFEGRVGCFSPVTYLSNTDLYLIRPMIYAKESDVEYFVRHATLPVVKSLCPEDRATEREEMKKLLHSLEKDNEGLRHRLFGALTKSGVDGWKPPEKQIKQ
jgi:tRNA(Ile)-lysidine synthase TilS/MesJ